jgi:hypothetical protein
MNQKITARRALIALVIVVGVGALLLGGLRHGYVGGNQQAAASVYQEVAALIELPAETPRIAAVTDTTQLPDQEFFKLAANGDQLLFFDTANRVILYRPSIKKIIKVTGVTTGDIKTPSAVEKP